jgi:cellulose biosynthesis protein BcsQ
LVDELVVNNLLDKSDSPAGSTLWSAVKPVVDAVGEARSIPAVEVRPNLFLLPGDVRLAEFEQELNTFWGECFQRKTRGFRGAGALSAIVTTAVRRFKIDYVFYDSGPNIGALNRVILLDCDHFIIPAACDLFSLRAISTLGHTLETWIKDWATIADLAPEDQLLLAGMPQLLGFIPQRFRVYRGLPAAQYARFLPLLEKRINSEVIARLRKIDLGLLPPTGEALKIGEVKDFGSLSTASQDEGVPIAYVDHAGTPDQKSEAKAVFTILAQAIMKRTE